MDAVVSLITLILMEIVLGIDNIVFLSIVIGGLPEKRQRSARLIGMGLALAARVLLLLAIRWVMGLEKALFHWSSTGIVPAHWVENHHVDAVTGRDIVLLAGGLFLIGKSVTEIHKKTLGDDDDDGPKKQRTSYAAVLVQIVLFDLVFSLDSVVSAVGMAKELWVMITAMLVAVGFMAAFSGAVSRFIERNPTFKMLALSFLVMIGVLLLLEGAGDHVNKGYIYAAMGFAVGVEVLNARVRARRRSKRAREAERAAAG